MLNVIEKRRDTQIAGENGDGIAFMGELAGDGAAEVWSDADNGGDAAGGGGACHAAHLSSGGLPRLRNLMGGTRSVVVGLRLCLLFEKHNFL